MSTLLWIISDVLPWAIGVIVLLGALALCVTPVHYENGWRLRFRLPLLWPAHFTYETLAGVTADNPLGHLTPGAPPTDYFAGINLPEGGFAGINWSFYPAGGTVDLSRRRRWPIIRLAVRVMFKGWEK